MEPILALVVATMAYAIVLTITYLVFVVKSPPEYRRPKIKEVLVILLISAIFFMLGYLLLISLK